MPRACLIGAIGVVLASAALAQPVNHVYFGNLHSHSSYSDGSGTPQQAFDHARFEGHLDFLALTEHNHSQCEAGASPDRRDGIMIATNHALYTDDIIPTAMAATAPGAFIALYGQEFSSISKGNHVNVFEIGEVIDAGNGRFDLLVTWLQAHNDTQNLPPIIQFNHPHLLHNTAISYGADDFPSKADWISNIDNHARLIEVLNGPAMAKTSGNRPDDIAEFEYLYYLDQGFHLAPTADQDNHYFTWGTSTDARTAIIAPELTRPALLAAMRARHVYATEDKNLRAIFTVSGRLCGDRIGAPAQGSELAISYTLQDDDEPTASYDVEVYSGTYGEGIAVVVDQLTVDGNSPPGGSYTIQDVHYTGGTQYVFFKLTQHSEHGPADRLWTAPVWLEPGSQPPAPTPAGAPAGEADLVASIHSTIYHTSLLCSDAQRIKPENRVTGPDAKRGRTLHEGCPH